MVVGVAERHSGLDISTPPKGASRVSQSSLGMGSPLCIIWDPLWPQALNQAPFWGSIKFEPPMCSAFTDSVESTQQIGVGRSAWVEYPSGIDGFCSLYLHSPQILICSSNSNDWSAHWMGIIIERLTQFICKDIFLFIWVFFLLWGLNVSIVTILHLKGQQNCRYCIFPIFATSSNINLWFFRFFDCLVQ